MRELSRNQKILLEWHDEALWNPDAAAAFRSTRRDRNIHPSRISRETFGSNIQDKERYRAIIVTFPAEASGTLEKFSEYLMQIPPRLYCQPALFCMELRQNRCVEARWAVSLVPMLEFVTRRSWLGEDDSRQGLNSRLRMGGLLVYYSKDLRIVLWPM